VYWRLTVSGFRGPRRGCARRRGRSPRPGRCARGPRGCMVRQPVRGGRARAALAAPSGVGPARCAVARKSATSSTRVAGRPFSHWRVCGAPSRPAWCRRLADERSDHDRIGLSTSQNRTRAETRTVQHVRPRPTTAGHACRVLPEPGVAGSIPGGAPAISRKRPSWPPCIGRNDSALGRRADLGADQSRRRTPRHSQRLVRVLVLGYWPPRVEAHLRGNDPGWRPEHLRACSRGFGPGRRRSVQRSPGGARAMREHGVGETDTRR